MAKSKLENILKKALIGIGLAIPLFFGNNVYTAEKQKPEPAIETAQKSNQTEKEKRAEQAYNLLTEGNLAKTKEEKRMFYQRIVDKYPETSWVCSARFELSSLIDNDEERIEAYKKFVKDYPKESLAGNEQYGIGMEYEKLGKLEEAIEEYSKVGNYMITTASTRIAKIYEKQGKADEAIKQYQSIINKFSEICGGDTSAANAHESIAEIYKKQNNLEGALEEYQKIVDKSNLNHPSGVGPGWHTHAHYALIEIGKLHEKAGEDEKAIEAYRKSADLYPGWIGSDAALFAIGNIYSRTGRKEKAEGVFKELLEKYPAGEFSDYIKENIFGIRNFNNLDKSGIDEKSLENKSKN